MKATELFEYYEASEDNVSRVEIGHTRRPRITLRHLNKLRKMRNLENLENAERMKSLKDVYGGAE